MGMKKWWGNTKTPVTTPQFETQQQKLSRMSEEVVRRYQREMSREINDPDRLAAVYGSAFATGDAVKQARTVCLMAASMLKVPNSDVQLVWPDRQESVASVRDYLPADTCTAPITDSWCKHVIATGREVAVEEGNAHPLVCDTSFARQGLITSYLGVPVANREGVIIGVLCVHTPEHREWGIADVSMLTQLSVVLTRAMQPEQPAAV